MEVMRTLKGIVDARKRVDMVICNYVYEHVEDNKQHVIKYDNALPERQDIWLEFGQQITVLTRIF